MIGLERGVVRLVPFTPEWKRLFETERERLIKAVGKYILDIQHVGSTSIPGMVAKPIIDIAIAIQDFEKAKICIKPIEELGYEFRGELGIPRRHFFGLGEPRQFHLHMNEVSSIEWDNQLLFRDILIRDEGLSNAYAALKTDLAKRYPQDRDAYLLGKAPFIEMVLKKGRENRERVIGIGKSL